MYVTILKMLPLYFVHCGCESVSPNYLTFTWFWMWYCSFCLCLVRFITGTYADYFSCKRDRMITLFWSVTQHPYFRSLIRDWWYDEDFENPRHKHHGDWLLLPKWNVASSLPVCQSLLVSVQATKLVWLAFIVQLQRLHKLHVVTFQR
jgi:hypothetical protein